MLSVLIAATVAASSPSPAPVRIHAGEPLANFANLKPGVRRYLRYRVLKDVWRPMDIWQREIRFDTQDGERRLHIVQSWNGSMVAPHVLRLDSWFKTGSFAPITHERRYERAEETRNEGFRFDPERVVGLPSTPANTRATFVQDGMKGVFNFETDMETIETLPLAPGYAATLRFYHPGGPPPADYVVKVVGSAKAPAEGDDDCWLVTLGATDDSSDVPSRFFVSKSSGQVVRVEQPQADGTLIVKTRI